MGLIWLHEALWNFQWGVQRCLPWTMPWSGDPCCVMACSTGSCVHWSYWSVIDFHAVWGIPKNVNVIQLKCPRWEGQPVCSNNGIYLQTVCLKELKLEWNEWLFLLCSIQLLVMSHIVIFETFYSKSQFHYYRFIAILRWINLFSFCW